MGDNTKRLTEWAIQKIKTEYPEDVALLAAVDGHSTDGDGHGECFDYYIPATEKSLDMAMTFIVNGVGNDLYPRTWERMQRSVTLDEGPIRCLRNAKILYARSDEDRDRFLSMQEALEKNLKDPVLTYKKALEKLDEAMDIYRTLMFEEKLCNARMAAGYIQYFLSAATALVNGTVADSALYSKMQAENPDAKSGMYHCPDMEAIPEHFYDRASAILHAESIEELKAVCGSQIRAARDFLSGYRPEQKVQKESVNYQMLADWYQEMILFWRRIAYFCKNGMAEEAFIDGVNLQGDLNVITNEFGLDEMDLLGAYDTAHLDKFAERAGEVEKKIRQIIAEHGGVICEYADLEEFLREN